MQEYLVEKWYRAVDTFYLFFGTEEYLKNREPSFMFGVWICKSVEWEYFNTYKEAVNALRKLGKDPI